MVAYIHTPPLLSHVRSFTSLLDDRAKGIGMPFAWLGGGSQRLRRWWRGPAVIVVSGLPRSGTSMMMRMLEAGGIAILSDGERQPDVDNPFGYYEDQRVLDLAPSADMRWVKDARGRALKVISHLLPQLPAENFYDVILMRRELDAVITSQNRMLERRGEANPLDDAETRARFERHLGGVRRMLAGAPQFRCLELDFADTLREPGAAAAALAGFLGRTLDLGAMAAAVDPSVSRSGAGPAATPARRSS
jgi:hypothetical protein